MKLKLLPAIIGMFLGSSFIQKANAQCSTTSTPSMYVYSYWNINAFSLNSIASNNPGAGTNGYGLYPTVVRTLTIGNTYNFTATFGASYVSTSIAIWIDLNSNNQYENSEMLVSTYGAYNANKSGSITIPSGSTPGTNVRMRVRGAATYYTSIQSSQACGNYIQSSYGETEDYYVNLVAPCPAPVISAQPQNKTNVCEASTTIFSVTATNTSFYKWQRKTGPTTWTDVTNGGVYSGATTKDLKITGVPLNFNGYEFRCVLEGACLNPINSNSATMTTLPGAFITSQVDDDTSCEGTSTQLSLTAAGSPTGYQWQMAVPTVGIYSDVPAQYPYSGVNTNTLNIASVQDTMQGYVFRAKVTSQCNTPMTSNIKMNVLLPPVISSDPVDDTVNSGDFAEFKVDVTGKEYSYYWQASSDGGTKFVNINEGGLYTGVNTGALIVSPVGLGQGGWKFRCIIKSTNPSCGDYRDTSNFAMIYVRNPSSVSDVSKDAIEINTYPNPNTGGELFIQATTAINGNVTVNVLDNMGKTVLSQSTGFNKQNTASINTNRLAAGIYLLQLVGNDGAVLTTRKFTRQ